MAEPKQDRKPTSIQARSILSSRNLEPYVAMYITYDDGSEQQVAQWTTAEAYHHVMVCLNVIEAASTDAFLVSFLCEKTGANVEQASSILQDFRAWRDRHRTPERPI